MSAPRAAVNFAAPVPPPAPHRPHMSPLRRRRAAPAAGLSLLAALAAGVAAASIAIAPLAAQGPAPLRADSALRDDRAFSFYDRGPYRAAVPRPDSLLGYAIGEMNTQYAAQERVLLTIADAAKDRVRVEPLGTTYERRAMRLYVVSSPENIARLDQIRADLDRLADPRGASQAELDAVAARTPVVVWISESVHGNESPGFESGMQLLYQLAASEEPATVAALRDAIVVLNPSSNPDGHERFTVWYNSINVASPDNGAYEHREPWSIQGRYNHYRFDMNRDVIATTQREVQGIVRGMLRWHPMVAVDQHGQTTNYFFPPAAAPVNENLGPNAAKWLDVIGRGNAAAFDRYGWMYYSRDVFDLYYPGYWDTWPSLTGATGMTYETDGGGWKGLLWRREDGSLLSFRDGIAKHFVAALATVETIAANRAARVRDYLRFRQDAVALGRSERMKRVVFLPGSDPGRAAELAAALLRAGVEVRRASAGFSAARAHAYADDAAMSSRRFDGGAYVVDLAQPQGRVAKAVLEPSPALDSAFARRQREKFRRNLQRGKDAPREEYEFYDVTAWSLPVAFGVEAYWTEDAPPVAGELLALPGEACTERSDCEPPLPQAQQQPRRVGGELLAVDVGGGIVAGRGARSAYLFTAERNGASRLAYQLLAAGYRVAASTQPLDAGGRSWPRGTYIVRVARNDTTLAARLDQLARESGVDVTGVNSAFTERGQYGIGSESTVGLVAPSVAVLSDEGVSQTSYGALWWNFERRYGVTFTPVSYGYLTGSDLSKLNVIILPSASPGVLSSRLGKDGAARLRDWVRGGGTLIAMGGASAWAAREDVNLTSARAVTDDGDAAPSGGGASGSGATAGDSAKPTTGGAQSEGAANRQRERVPDKAQDRALEPLGGIVSPTASGDAPQPVPGAFFDVTLDRTHWLTHGFEQPRLTVLFEGSTFLKLSRNGSNVAVFPSTGPLVRAGFTFPENTERLLRGTALLVEEPVGDGHVILFANEPMFRGWWRSLDRLVLNGIVLGPAF